MYVTSQQVVVAHNVSINWQLQVLQLQWYPEKDVFHAYRLSH